MALGEAVPPMPESFAPEALPSLTDARGRVYTYLRLSVTDRCDLACVYCMPPGGEDEHARRTDVLSFEEIVRLVGVFSAGGVRRVRLTGGEPLVRKDIVRLVAMIHDDARVPEIALTSNATRLAELARPLKAAGLSSVNVSIDSLDSERFGRITRGGVLREVLAGIHAALAAGLEVKLNTVPLRGENDDELEAIVDFAWSLGITPRFIELMPLGEGAALYASKLVPNGEVAERLRGRLEGREGSFAEGKGPAKYLRAADGSGREVGFINATTGNFCDACNRVRVTAKGDVRPCLASRRAVSLRDVMRGANDDRHVAWALRWALGGKNEGHHFTEAAVTEHENVGMSLIGG
jgi:cyclic pyranopterin phosphate synthase